MLKPNFKCLGLLVALATSNITMAQNHSVAQIKLKDLRSSHSSVSYHSDKSTILMFFQPDCPWCKKQAKVMAELQHQCEKHIGFTLVGDKGSRTQLKRELRHFDDQMTAKQSSKKFARSSGGIIGYPTTLVIDNQGNIVAKKRGMVGKELLYQLASELSGGTCGQ
ncbi:TlpA family protein disulfide reductase [Shewanella waksmanii]|uniref:TlpA family protein disulfide reductase n=1 Tax=Shewanella waksmanii TaxID=213783 RepID=UPI003736D72B